MKVNVRKSSGPDAVPNWVLRDFAGCLAGPLSAIYNSSFREAYVPPLMKTADAVPLPKVKPLTRL